MIRGIWMSAIVFATIAQVIILEPQRSHSFVEIKANVFVHNIGLVDVKRTEYILPVNTKKQIEKDLIKIYNMPKEYLNECMTIDEEEFPGLITECIGWSEALTVKTEQLMIHINSSVIWKEEESDIDSLFDSAPTPVRIARKTTNEDQEKERITVREDEMNNIITMAADKVMEKSSKVFSSEQEILDVANRLTKTNLEPELELPQGFGDAIIESAYDSLRSPTKTKNMKNSLNLRIDRLTASQKNLENLQKLLEKGRRRRRDANELEACIRVTEKKLNIDHLTLQIFLEILHFPAEAIRTIEHQISTARRSRENRHKRQTITSQLIQLYEHAITSQFWNKFISFSSDVVDVMPTISQLPHRSNDNFNSSRHKRQSNEMIKEDLKLMTKAISLRVNSTLSLMRDMLLNIYDMPSSAYNSSHINLADLTSLYKWLIRPFSEQQNRLFIGTIKTINLQILFANAIDIMFTNTEEKSPLKLNPGWKLNPQSVINFIKNISSLQNETTTVPSLIQLKELQNAISIKFYELEELQRINEMKNNPDASAPQIPHMSLPSISKNIKLNDLDLVLDTYIATINSTNSSHPNNLNDEVNTIITSQHELLTTSCEEPNQVEKVKRQTETSKNSVAMEIAVQYALITRNESTEALNNLTVSLTNMKEAIQVERMLYNRSNQHEILKQDLENEFKLSNRIAELIDKINEGIKNYNKIDLVKHYDYIHEITADLTKMAPIIYEFNNRPVILHRKRDSTKPKTPEEQRNDNEIEKLLQLIKINAHAILYSNQPNECLFYLINQGNLSSIFQVPENPLKENITFPELKVFADRIQENLLKNECPQSIQDQFKLNTDTLIKVSWEKLMEEFRRGIVAMFGRKLQASLALTNVLRHQAMIIGVSSLPHQGIAKRDIVIQPHYQQARRECLKWQNQRKKRDIWLRLLEFTHQTINFFSNAGRTLGAAITASVGALLQGGLSIITLVVVGYSAHRHMKSEMSELRAEMAKDRNSTNSRFEQSRLNQLQIVNSVKLITSETLANTEQTQARNNLRNKFETQRQAMFTQLDLMKSEYDLLDSVYPIDKLRNHITSSVSLNTLRIPALPLDKLFEKKRKVVRNGTLYYDFAVDMCEEPYTHYVIAAKPMTKSIQIYKGLPLAYVGVSFDNSTLCASESNDKYMKNCFTPSICMKFALEGEQSGTACLSTTRDTQLRIVPIDRKQTLYFNPLESTYAVNCSNEQITFDNPLSLAVNCKQKETIKTRKRRMANYNQKELKDFKDIPYINRDFWQMQTHQDDHVPDFSEVNHQLDELRITLLKQEQAMKTNYEISVQPQEENFWYTMLKSIMASLLGVFMIAVIVIAALKWNKLRGQRKAREHRRSQTYKANPVLHLFDEADNV